VRTAGECAQQMCKYDSLVPLSLDAVDEGQEPQPLVDALWATSADARSGPPHFPQRNAVYDHDFDLIDTASSAPGTAHLDPSPRVAGGLSELGAEAVWESLRSTPRSGRASAQRVGSGNGSSMGPRAPMPIVPPLQLNTFPISPPLSARTPQS
jgi:hypothetical protein